MDKKLIEEVMFCLSDDRNTYQYFKDKYCMFLLNHFIKDTISIKQLKNSEWSQFCQKPLIKKWLANMGSQRVEKGMATSLWQSDVFHFTITLGQWGGVSPNWQQTCRKGYNLVIQLNFTRSHDRKYEKIAEPGRQPFCYYNHPVNKERNTMAWARLDISEDFSEVLIEEIQNDWLRLAERKLNHLKIYTSLLTRKRYGIKSELDQFQSYFNSQLKPLVSIWDEAILCATIEFIHDNLGTDRIFMYDHDTGAKLKSISNRLPPRSLYTKLPKKFGFKLIDEAPEFIQSDRMAAKKLNKLKKQAIPQWHLLTM